MENKKIAIIAGATGLVGSHLTKILLEKEFYHEVITIGRSTLDISDSKLKQIKFDYEQKDSFKQLPKADALFCCLGTTIKKAGSQENFKKVDYVYPLKLGEWAKQNGVKNMHIITALGADASSSIFYNQVKGEVENDLKSVALHNLCIYQPSIILGDRNESRLGESIGKWAMRLFSPLMVGGLKKYKPIHGQTIAQAMYLQSTKNLTGNKTFESNEIQNLADTVA